MYGLLRIGFQIICVLLGFFGGQGHAHDGWDKYRQSNRMCPSEDTVTHRCYKMITRNSTCLVSKVIGCDPDYTSFCRLMVEHERQPCTVYSCSDQGCCEGYIENEDFKCVSEAKIKSIRCENGGTKSETGTCSCTKYYKGRRCEVPICNGTCLNGGRCETYNGVPRCICPSSLYSGQFCGRVSCEGSCLNGGKCIQDGVLARCTCTHGYQGDVCQFPIKENCPVVQSKNHAACGQIWNECESDLDCENKTLKTACCYNGCKGVCRTPELNQCSYKGNVYNSGDTFSPEPCKKCVCQMYGEVTCSTVDCEKVTCSDDKEAVMNNEHSCEVCPGMETTDHREPWFTNCPERFVVLNVSENADHAQLPSLGLRAMDVYGKLDVFYSQMNFNHTRQPELSMNIHIVTAYSECDNHGRRAECNFRVIVRDPYPPIFQSCPADIYADEDEIISWADPSVSDNVGLHDIKVDCNLKRDRKWPVGTYVVSYTAWDYDMNQAICTFLVRIYSSSYYYHTEYVDRDFSTGKFPIGTVVGITSGLMIAVGMCICFTTYAARQRREQEEEQHQREQNFESVYSVNDSSVSPNPNLYDNMDGKIPYLPEYTPRIEPPSYEEIGIGTADKEGDQIYDELKDGAGSNVAQANQEAENMVESGEVNKAFESEETENKTMNENK